MFSINIHINIGKNEFVLLLVFMFAPVFVLVPMSMGSARISMNIGIRMSLNNVFNVSFNGCRNTSTSTNIGINFDSYYTNR